MRQTEKYEFHLLDGEDRISPKPLNENVNALVEALDQKDLALLHAVGMGGYNARIAFGQYQGEGRFGEGTPTSVEVDFKPMLLAVAQEGRVLYAPFVRPVERGEAVNGVLGDAFINLTWLDRGVKWYSGTNTSYQLNDDGTVYHWVAIGYDDTDYEGEADGEA